MGKPKGTLGKLLKAARVKLHLRQQEVAGLVGVTPAYVCKLEKCINPPSAELCIKLAKVLKLDVVRLQRMALAEREGVDLAVLMASVKSNPLVRLDHEEERLVREWRKLDDHWKQTIVNLMIKAQEMLAVLEEADVELKATAQRKK